MRQGSYSLRTPTVPVEGLGALGVDQLDGWRESSAQHRGQYIVRRSQSRARGDRSLQAPGEPSHAAEPSGLDRVNQHVPLVLLQDNDVFSFADPDRVALDDDLRAIGARGAERDPFHTTSPPFALRGAGTPQLETR